jgi:hypothetical protein
MTSADFEVNRFLELPIELQCEIISHQTDPQRLIELASVNRHLHQLVRDCVTHIDSPSSKESQVPVVLRFPRIRLVMGEINVNTIGDLILLTNLPSLREAAFVMSPSAIIEWIVGFIKQYCSGYFTNYNGFVDQHHRNLKTSTFAFLSNASPQINVTIDHGVLDMINYSSDETNFEVMRPIIRVLHQNGSMIGLVLGRSIDRDLIGVLLRMDEFHILKFETVDGEPLEPEALAEFIQANKIDELVEINQDSPAAASNTQLLVNLTSANPLRIADLPVLPRSLSQIVNKLPHLELIGVYLSPIEENENDENEENENEENENAENENEENENENENAENEDVANEDEYDGMENEGNVEETHDISDIAATVREVLELHPKLQIKLWTDLYEGDLIDKFMTVYTGPRDRLIIPTVEM